MEEISIENLEDEDPIEDVLDWDLEERDEYMKNNKRMKDPTTIAVEADE